MPELPEVEVVRAGLAPAVTGARISGVEVVDERSLRRHDRAAGDFEGLLTGRTIEAAVRRGKFLWLPVGDGLALVGHLGMSGQLLLREAGAPADRHLRIRLGIEHPEHGELAVHFVDQRVFGGMAVDRLVPTLDGGPGGDAGLLSAARSDQDAPWRTGIPTQVAHIARDPVDPRFDPARFRHLVAGKSSGIKRVLLDQGVVSGIGNIYADESLWGARIHPEQPASSLSRRKVDELLHAIELVLRKALAEGGTSFDAQYVNVNGQAGYFAHSLEAYGRQGRECRRCGTPIVREQFMNRGSHRCPRCQRLRAPRTAVAAA
ncbi:bifunctional DNA-formamidopyrimidine glycosylase/DNA-(apurinic or apyrimidinic site) lyase [Agromyces seonyuensis]|uniref:Formamidopyrimidine-DNA glycosylase n=1 Tax=Agromyces seonyuensis TaxID=2662446 RepID=A0A6I4NZ33_9MICO|nr:bifunctional DNA-formamidopyrimidine glycosylase/DNA-(apurinic or apyrimidinic site) lyase [Agromyces seonyuensis]MWB97695.1 bifunctional DNA-formamidopyrimidine glycosylase/DNA-(apurinic or apyrimidinic site) lyase [Agromyces seonyuensis]